MTVGSHVRVLTIQESLMEGLARDEAADLRAMVGGIFEVYEIDQWGAAWVANWWPRDRGASHSHSIGLDPHEMELAEAADTPPS